MTLEWWEPANPTDDSIWYKEEKMTNLIKEDDMWYRNDDDEVNDLWAQVEIDHLAQSGYHYKPQELVDNQPGYKPGKGKRKVVNEDEEED